MTTYTPFVRDRLLLYSNVKCSRCINSQGNFCFQSDQMISQFLNYNNAFKNIKRKVIFPKGKKILFAKLLWFIKMNDRVCVNIFTIRLRFMNKFIHELVIFFLNGKKVFRLPFKVLIDLIYVLYMCLYVFGLNNIHEWRKGSWNKNTNKTVRNLRIVLKIIK